MKKLILFLFIFVFALNMLVFAGGSSESEETTKDGRVIVRMLTSSDERYQMFKPQVEEFNNSQNEIYAEMVTVPPNATDLYGTILQNFEAKKSTIDIIPVDTIWPGDFEDHLIDLYPLGAKEYTDKMIKGLVENNTVNGKLLALPLFSSVGLLIYRKDLVEKYGYSGPPKTWKELEEMSKKIQAGERKTNPDFWGFVWQGKAYEGLVCDALEWTYSNSEDVWISNDKKITINNPDTKAIFKEVKSWIGTISPEGVLTYQEEEARNFFQSGNAAFQRNWYYAYAAANEEGSPLKGKVDIAPLPAGKSGHGGSTIGSEALGISKYSKNPEASYKFFQFLYSEEKFIERIGSHFPSLTDPYKDPAIIEQYPILEKLGPIFANAVARPAVPTAPNYNNVAVVIAKYIHEMISGKRDIDTGVEELALELEDITGFPQQ